MHLEASVLHAPCLVHQSTSNALSSSQECLPDTQYFMNTSQYVHDCAASQATSSNGTTWETISLADTSSPTYLAIAQANRQVGITDNAHKLAVAWDPLILLCLGNDHQCLINTTQRFMNTSWQHSADLAAVHHPITPGTPQDKTKSLEGNLTWDTLLLAPLTRGSRLLPSSSNPLPAQLDQ